MSISGPPPPFSGDGSSKYWSRDVYESQHHLNVKYKYDLDCSTELSFSPIAAVYSESMVSMFFPVLLALLATINADSIRIIQDSKELSEAVKDAPSFPVWPKMFQQNFDEVFTYPILGSHKTNGTYYYDYANLRYRIDRTDGQYDRYCGLNGLSVFQDTPCSQLVIKGMRWLIYPEKKTCCQCCTSKQGCGILFPTWMNNATFIGKVGKTKSWCHHWNSNISSTHWRGCAIMTMWHVSPDFSEKSLT